MYVLTFVHEITDRKQVESELRGVLEPLEREVQARRKPEAQLLQARKLEVIGRITRGIAHDFNNLLTVVKGNLELLRQEGGDWFDSGQSLLRRSACVRCSTAKPGSALGEMAHGWFLKFHESAKPASNRL